MSDSDEHTGDGNREVTRCNAGSYVQGVHIIRRSTSVVSSTDKITRVYLDGGVIYTSKASAQDTYSSQYVTACRGVYACGNKVYFDNSDPKIALLMIDEANMIDGGDVECILHEQKELINLYVNK